jgi:hypothetical protein
MTASGDSSSDLRGVLGQRGMEQNFLLHPLFEKTGVSFRLLEPDNNPTFILHQLSFAVFLGAPTQLSHGD